MRRKQKLDYMKAQLIMDLYLTELEECKTIKELERIRRTHEEIWSQEGFCNTNDLRIMEMETAAFIKERERLMDFGILDARFLIERYPKLTFAH